MSLGVAVGFGVFVGLGVAVGFGVAVSFGVAVGLGVAVIVGVAVAPPPPSSPQLHPIPVNVSATISNNTARNVKRFTVSPF